MHITRLVVIIQLVLLLLLPDTPGGAPQSRGFELPVQLIGFPVIIIAVRLSKFVKQLSYALNPNTYVSRKQRDISGVEPAMDVAEVEKRLIAELGENACVYERVCVHYAQLAKASKEENRVLDWENIFSKYKHSPDRNKEFYLLSVFMGDIIKSPQLCHQLAKRGRTCGDSMATDR